MYYHNDLHVTGRVARYSGYPPTPLLGSPCCVHRSFLSNVCSHDAGCANPGTPASWEKAVRFAKIEYAHRQVEHMLPRAPMGYMRLVMARRRFARKRGILAQPDSHNQTRGASKTITMRAPTRDLKSESSPHLPGFHY